MNRDLARIVIGYVFVHSAMAGTRMAAPLLGLTLGYDKAAIGILVALVALPQVVLALPAGRWADRRGIKVPIRSSVVLATAGALLSAAWPLYSVLCLTALLAGAAIAAATISLQRHVGRMTQTRDELKQAFAWLSLAPALSNFVGPFIVGLCIDNLGYRAAFVALAVLPVTGWLSLRNVRETAPAPARSGKRETAWSLWRDPSFRRLLLMNWFMSASFDVHGFVVPVLGHERGLPASVIGTILGCFAIAAAGARLAMPIITTRLRDWILISGAAATTGVLFAVYPFVHSPVGMGLCSALLGMSFGCVQPIVMSLLHHITPEHRRGEAVAMRILMINASSVAMPLLFGAASGVIGVSSLFWAMGAVVGLGSRVGFRLRGMDDSGHH